MQALTSSSKKNFLQLLAIRNMYFKSKFRNLHFINEALFMRNGNTNLQNHVSSTKSLHSYSNKPPIFVRPTSIFVRYLDRHYGRLFYWTYNSPKSVRRLLFQFLN